MSAPSNLLASLQLAVHPAVAQAVSNAAALVAQRQYRRAETQLRAFLTNTQAAIQATKQQSAGAGSEVPAAAAAAASAASASSSSSAVAADLPTLSQLLTGVLPYLRTLANLQREADTADYDLRLMQTETDKYKKEWAEYTARRSAAEGDAAALAALPAPPARPPHAEYCDSRLQIAAIPGRSRGLIASSHCAQAPGECVAAVAASAGGPPPACIPACTTVLVCRAVGLVTDDAEEPASVGAAAATVAGAAEALSLTAREERMASALVTLLALKMQAQPSLIRDLYQLDAGERYEEDRARRLAQQRSPLDTYRPAAAAAAAVAAAAVEDGAAEAAVVDPADLEIDLERLALIVARNAFAPPQDSAALQAEAPPSAALSGNDRQKLLTAAAAAAAPASATRSSGVWIACSFLNHSCRPNCHWFCVGDAMFVRTLREVREGEELTLSYTGFDARLYRERQEACAGWGFQCNCAAWCEPFLSHAGLAEVEEAFVAATKRLEPQVHELVEATHAAQEGTLAHRRALKELAELQTNLQKLVQDFRNDIAALCGPQCVGKGTAREDGDLDQPTAAAATKPSTETPEAEADLADGAAPASATAAATPDASASSAAKKKKKKKKSAAAAGSSTAAAATTPCPPHTRQLLLHLSLPLSLLALCQVSLHDGRSTASMYLASLGQAESLSLEALSLLSRQYGPGDETVVYGWMEVLNTWMQFAQAGVEFRSVEQMQAVLNDVCVQSHCKQFGAKLDHFKLVWMNTMQNMQISELLEA